MRTREVWIHAVDLANGARFTSFPDIVLESLLTDIAGTWQRKGVGGDLVIEMTGAEPVTIGSEGSDSRRVVRGPLAGVVHWAAGRGAIGCRPTGAYPYRRPGSDRFAQLTCCTAGGVHDPSVIASGQYARR